MKTRCRSWVWLIGFSMLTLTGCGAPIGWLVNAFAPPQKVEPEYVLPQGQCVLVFVDDMINPVNYEPIKSDLTAVINGNLLQYAGVAETISYEEILTLMSADSNFNQMSISEIGDRLGADLVVYVQIKKFSLKDDDSTLLWKGQLEATVRVVKVGEGRLWPEDRPGGHPIRPVETPSTANSAPLYGEQLTRLLAIKAGKQISQLFYEHEITAKEAADLEKDRKPNSGGF